MTIRKKTWHPLYLTTLTITSALSLWAAWITTRVGDVSLHFHLFALPMFAHLLPAVQSGDLPYHASWLLLPVIMTSLLWSYIAWREMNTLFWQALLWLLSLCQLYYILPPTCSPGTLGQPAYRPFFLLLLAGSVLVAMVPLWARKGSWLLLSVLTGIADLLAIWQYWLILPQVRQLYRQSWRIGTGPFWLLLAWGITLGLARQEISAK